MKSVFALIAVLFAPVVSVAISIETVPIGNPSNAGELQPQGLFGRVTTSYRIGKTEITNAQYTEFLNAKAATDPYGLYNASMGIFSHGGITRSGSSGSYAYAVKANVPGEGPGGSDYTYADKPVVYVSWYDAARFANWMHNNQGGGNTEGGAYTIMGGTPTPSNGNSISRNTGAVWFLPSENEWYKAAYYNGTSSQYSDYPTGVDAVPNNNLPSADTGNSANFVQDGEPATGNLSYPMTGASAYALSDSSYGTFDQGGNVWEWNEALVTSTTRGRRGGAWDGESPTLSSSYRDNVNPATENSTVGFRLATIPTPVVVLGDYNANGTVDTAEYILWRNGGPLMNEVHNPGTVSDEDYTEWRSRFGNPPGSGGGLAAAVPEPDAGRLALLAIAALLCNMQGRRCGGRLHMSMALSTGRYESRELASP